MEVKQSCLNASDELSLNFWTFLVADIKLEWDCTHPRWRSTLIVAQNGEKSNLSNLPFMLIFAVCMVIHFSPCHSNCTIIIIIIIIKSSHNHIIVVVIIIIIIIMVCVLTWWLITFSRPISRKRRSSVLLMVMVMMMMMWYQRETQIHNMWCDTNYQWETQLHNMVWY